MPNHPPLPRALGAAVASAKDALSNPSLLWQRYPKVYDGHELLQSKQFTEHLKWFVSSYSERSQTYEPPLLAHHERLSALPGVLAFSMETLGPLVTGLGQDHPTENGFTFDPLLAVPYLPGTTLKGLCRAGAKLIGVPSGQISAVLGREPPGRGEDGDLARGAVAFVGAWPARWPRLKVELLAPHHPTYQDDQGLRPAQRSRRATYVEEPKPISFMAVAASTSFRFYLRPLSQGDALPLAVSWLQAGAEHLGAGGKTSSGFGRMSLR